MAYSRVKKIDTNTYQCAHGGVRLNEKQNAKIDKIVDYLNSGGDSDWKLLAMFKGIPVAETLSDGHKRWTEIIEVSGGYVLAKNIIKFYNQYTDK